MHTLSPPLHGGQGNYIRGMRYGSKDAKYGWYRYDFRFGIPVYEDDEFIAQN